MNMHMSSRNIAVQRDVYAALKREKRPGESFTELFVRIIHQRAALNEVRGAWGTTGAARDLQMLDRMRRGPRKGSE